MNPLELIAQAKARKLAEEAAARATQGGDPAALDATMGAPPLSEPRVPRQPSESMLAEKQFQSTPMHQFMQQRDEPGGMSSPTEFAGQMSNSGQLASGAGSGMPKNVLQMMIDKRKQLDAPRTPDPNVVAQARAKYADEARQNANAASGAYGGNAGDLAMGGGGPSLPGALSLIPRGGMRPMNAKEMIAYDAQRNGNVLDIARLGLSREQFNRQAKADESRFGIEDRQLQRQTDRDAAQDAFNRDRLKSDEERRKADAEDRRAQNAALLALAGRKVDAVEQRLPGQIEGDKARAGLAAAGAAAAPRKVDIQAKKFIAAQTAALGKKRITLAKMDKVIKDGGYTDPENGRWVRDVPSEQERMELQNQILEIEEDLKPDEPGQ